MDDGPCMPKLLPTKNPQPDIDCGCSSSYKFSYKPTQKAGEKGSGSSNSPMECVACHTCHWKYAMPRHWAQHHAPRPLPEQYVLSDAEKGMKWAKQKHVAVPEEFLAKLRRVQPRYARAELSIPQLR